MNGNPSGFIVFESLETPACCSEKWQAGRIRVCQHLPFALHPSWVPFGAQPCRHLVSPTGGLELAL